MHQPENAFVKRTVPMPDLKNDRIFPGGIKVKALFAPECKWRLVEEFDPKCFTEQEDGRLLFQADYTDKENLLTWLMTFMEQAELLEPREMREELKRRLVLMQKKYEEQRIKGE